jgi:propionate CoA-transferase
VDITANAKHVVFCSSFTGKGLKVDFSGGKVKIEQEGELKKCVKKVQQISYNAGIAREKGQKMTYVTERCVFELKKEGLVLTEIAEGVDLQKDILDQMEFTPVIAENLKKIPVQIYNDGPFGLSGII